MHDILVINLGLGSGWTFRRVLGRIRAQNVELINKSSSFFQFQELAILSLITRMTIVTETMYLCWYEYLSFSCCIFFAR